MATVSLAPQIKRQFFDANGNPLSGGKVYTYQSGTTTLQTTYTDATGATPNANPIILDSAGQADIWLDVSLSYKFVVKDSNDVTLKTDDGIIGLLTNNSVSTAALQALSVTTPKLALNSVTSTVLSSDPSIDGNRAVGTNHIQNSAVTRPKIDSTSIFIMPIIRALTSGSGTMYPDYAFICTTPSVVPTAGATYTNNSVTWTVVAAIQHGTTYVIYANGNGSPSTSGTLTKASGTGDSTLTFAANYFPKYMDVEALGAGGGGGGSGSGSPGTGGAGGNTTFGTITAGGGSGGRAAGITSAATGGTATGGDLNIPGTNGAGGGNTGNVPGPAGAASPFGGGGGGGIPGSPGNDAAANTGAGGGGAGAPASASGTGGAGPSGGYVKKRFTNVAASYSYGVGAGGTAGAAGTSGFIGGVGGSGLIAASLHYQ